MGLQSNLTKLPNNTPQKVLDKGMCPILKSNLDFIFQ